METDPTATPSLAIAAAPEPRALYVPPEVETSNDRLLALLDSQCDFSTTAV